MGRGSHDRDYKVTTPHDHKIVTSQGRKTNFVIDSSIPISDYVPIDISSSNPEILHLDLSTSADLSQYINAYLHKFNAKVAYGGYLEVRDIYKRSNEFTSNNPQEIRNIHLGVDFWCAVNTPVTAVLRGKVHSFQNNKNLGDYGPTIILEHEIQGEQFYTLYGHLSLESLDTIEVGQEINDGQVIGWIGSAEVNGDYPPHLHFQIIEDMQGLFGDYPGVSCLKNLEFYKDNCPNPNSLLHFLKS